MAEWFQEVLKHFHRMDDYFRLHKEETWKSYEAMGIRDMPEQALLKTACDVFEAFWRSTYPWRDMAKDAYWCERYQNFSDYLVFLETSNRVHTQGVAGFVGRVSHHRVLAGVPDTQTGEGAVVLSAPSGRSDGSSESGDQSRGQHRPRDPIAEHLENDYIYSE